MLWPALRASERKAGKGRRGDWCVCGWMLLGGGGTDAEGEGMREGENVGYRGAITAEHSYGLR